MPITKSAKKAMRQSSRRRAINSKRLASLRILTKKFRALCSQKNFAEAQKVLPSVYRALDKTAGAHLIKKNKASRLKSRLTRMAMGSAQSRPTGK